MMAWLNLLLLSLAPSIVWLSPKNQVVGTLSSGQAYRTQFVYRNVGTDPVTIDNVRTTCGCTVPDWSRHPLPPGQSDTLHVVLEKNNRGRFRQKIKVYFHHQRRAEVLILSGQVE